MFGVYESAFIHGTFVVTATFPRFGGD